MTQGSQCAPWTVWGPLPHSPSPAHVPLHMRESEVGAARHEVGCLARSGSMPTPLDLAHHLRTNLHPAVLLSHEAPALRSGWLTGACWRELGGAAQMGEALGFFFFK